MIDLFADIDLFQFVPTINHVGDHFLIENVDPATASKLRELPGLRSLGKGAWKAPSNSETVPRLQSINLVWTPQAKLHAQNVEQIEQSRITDSRATDAELHLPGFGKQPFPFQRAGIRYALDRKRIIIGDEMGLGKTIQGLGTLFASGAYPALILVPASLKYNWEEEIKKCIPAAFVVMAEKQTPPLSIDMADVIITNYEQLVGFRTTQWRDDDGTLKKSRTCWADQTKKQVILSPLAQRLMQRGLKTIILDEAHYIKETDAGRTMAAKAVRPGTEYRLLLTGTPMLNRPREFVSLLQYLDRLDEFGGWYHFMSYYCGLARGPFGMEAKDANNTIELNTKLRSTCYVRRRKKDVLTELPPKTRTSYPVEIDNWDEYKHAEEQIAEWAKAQVRKNEAFLASIAHLDPVSREMAIIEKEHQKEEAAERGEQMVRLNALKQITARGKLKQAKAWIENFLESGEKLVVFATHKVILKALLEKYPNAARIMGEDDPFERQRNVKRFQEDPDCKLIICAMGTSATNSPGGVGHTLTAASNVLFLELGWNNALHDQCEDRCHRIGQHDNVTAHYLLGHNTIDVDIAELIESKRSISAQVTDGDTEVTETRIIDEVMRRITARAA